MTASAILFVVASLLGAPSGVSSALGPAVSAPLPVQVPGGEGRVEGRVVDPTSRAGIGGVQVRLDAREAQVTGEDGAFVLAAVEVGPHRLDAALQGFAPSPAVEVRVQGGRTTVVEIEYPLAAVTGVVAALPSASVPTPSVARAVLTGHEIAGAVGGLEDVSRVLQLRPGVLASQDDRNDVMVRGGGPIETAMIVDGFELPTASHFAQPGSSGGGLSLFAPFLVDQATLHTGGFSVAHGERASSVLEVALRAPRRKGVGGLAAAGAGGLLGMAEGAMPSGAWLVAARKSILEVAFDRKETQAVPRYHDVLARGTVTLGARHEVRLLLLQAAERADVSSAADNEPDELHEEQHLLVAGVGVRSEWRAGMRSSLSLSRSEATLDAYGGAANTVEGFDRSREAEWRVRAEVRQRLRGGEWLAGGTLKRATLRSDMENGGYRNPWGHFVAPVLVHRSDRFTDAAGYVEVSARLHPTLLATGGWRVDRWGGSETTTGGPRARLEYRPSSTFGLTLGGGVYRQAIPYVWSQSDAANRSLSPVRCLQGNVGFEAGVRTGRLAVEAFVKRYDDYPVDPTAPARVLVSAATDFETPFVGRLVAGGRVNVEGLDAIVSSPRWRGLEASSSVSWWHVSQRGLDGIWRRAEYDVRYQIRAWLSWRPSARWHGSAVWRYASGRPYTPFDVGTSIRLRRGRYDATQVNAETGPSYHRLDARVERVFSLRRAVVVAFAELDNVYDRDNLYVYTWSRVAKAAKPVYQWGLTPFAGVRVEF